MTRFKRILSSLVLLTITGAALAQNGTNSPFSRFGFGLLSDQSQGLNRNMGGVSMGLRSGMQINAQNPASYSALDSLNLVFDIGISLQNGNFSQNGTKVNARNTSFDYACVGFRAWKNLGMSIGFVPLTKIGYDFSTSNTVGKDGYTGYERKVTNTYYGDGGLHEVYCGLGWKPFGDLSIGVNAMYVWGSYANEVTQTYYENNTSTSAIYGLNRYYKSNIQTYKVNFGVQYQINLNKKNVLNLGAAVDLGHKVNNNARYTNYMSSSDSTEASVKNAFDLPWSYTAGFAWTHSNRLTIAADYSIQKWADCRFPHLSDEASSTSAYVTSKGQFMNRQKISAGAEYVPNVLGRRYLQRVHYRFGGYYATPYVKINGHDGPKEYSIGAGFGLPVLNTINNRSVLNLGFQWVHMEASSSFPKENYLRLTVGITFNERWFAKFKVD